jgi:LysM repeat protein
VKIVRPHQRPPAPSRWTLAGTPAATPAAQPRATATIAGGFREHTVQAGDTLFALAQRYTTTIEGIVAANNLPSRNVTLQVGQQLIIP